MTDMTLPVEAVEAAAKAQHGLTEVDWSAMSDSARAYALAGVERSLLAALPHLRPLVDPQELRLGIKVAFELGRQEAAKEIEQAADKIADGYSADAKVHRDLSIKKGPSPQAEQHMRTAVMFNNKAAGAWRVALVAEEVALRTADARTDPSGHTDLPPTPDALSKRLPEDDVARQIAEARAQTLREAAEAWMGRDDEPYPLADPVYRFLMEHAERIHPETP